VRTGRQVSIMKKAVLRATGWYNLRYLALVVAGARHA